VPAPRTSRSSAGSRSRDDYVKLLDQAIRGEAEF
jgi:hypothetical protein